jgi:DNA-binding response OmpR family regulator
MKRLKKLLLADDDENLLHAMALRCKQMQFDVRTAHDGASALKLIAADPPDLICLDVSMPGLSGLGLGELLVRDERYSAIPVIILTGQPASEVIPRCHNIPAYYIPKGPDAWSRLEPLLKELLGAPTAPGDKPAAASSKAEADLGDSPPWVLCIDDDQDVSLAIKLRLEAHGVAVVRAEAGMAGYRCAFRYPADAIILDYNLPDGRGDYIMQRFKDNPLTKDVPVIVITGENNPSIERRLRSLGAVNYFAKPLVFDDVLAELRNHIDVLAHGATAPIN